MIGNAHIDPVWLWQWPRATRGARDSSRRSTGWTSTPSSSSPATRSSTCSGSRRAIPSCSRRSRERVAEGRFQVIGGWWVEPDCNISVRLSYVRQALYGQRWLHDRFGVTATTGSNVDPFGHNAMLLQLLRKSGSTFLRLPPAGPERARAARSVSGGSRRTARGCLHTGSRTSTAARAATSTSTSRRRSRRCRRRTGADGLLRRRQPRRRADEGEHREHPASEQVDERNTAGRVQLARAFFDAAEDDDIPVHADELLHHAVGCYRRTRA